MYYRMARSTEEMRSGEKPEKSGRPVSHWTPIELADEAVKRGIVKEISPRSVGHFLKRSYSTTSSQSLLAQCSLAEVSKRLERW